MLTQFASARFDARFRVSEGVWSRDPRVICDCQQHRGRRRSRAFLRRVARLARKQAFAMAVALSLGVGIIQMPTSARTLRVTQPPPPPAVHAAAAVQPLRPVPLPQQLEMFAAPDRTLVSERVKEEFFRTEIPYGALIYAEAKRNGLPPELVAAVVKAESDFRPRLRSHKNAIGLMQLVPSTGALMGARDLLDPADNVRAGTRYLRYLYRRFGSDHAKVLAAYNAGEGNIARFGGIPPFRETHRYLQKIASNHSDYSRRLARRLAERQVGRDAAARAQLPALRVERALKSLRLPPLPPPAAIVEHTADAPQTIAPIAAATLAKPNPQLLGANDVLVATVPLSLEAATATIPADDLPLSQPAVVSRSADDAETAEREEASLPLTSTNDAPGTLTGAPDSQL